MSPQRDVVEGPNSPARLSTQILDQHKLNQTIAALRKCLKHELNRRCALNFSVGKNLKNRETDHENHRADYAFAQLRVERDFHSLVDEIGKARREIS